MKHPATWSGSAAELAALAALAAQVLLALPDRRDELLAGRPQPAGEDVFAAGCG